MSNPEVNRKQRFFAFRLAFKVGVALLLVMLVLGVLGQWALVITLVGMAIFLSISVLVFSTMIQVNRDSGSDDNHLPFTFLPMYRMLYSVVDPRPSRSEQERSERQQEDLKPFVFKENRGDGGQ
jgi:hypothetical protein